MVHEGENIRPEEDIFLAALDGEMSPDERARFDSNLAADEAFRGRFERYRQTVDLLRRLGPSPAPKTLLPSVQRRITRRTVQSSWPTLRFPYEMLVFVVILGALMYMYFNMLPASPGPFTVREAPATLQLDLSKPLPAELVEKFGLADPGDAAPGSRAYYGRLGREQAGLLLQAVAPYLEDKPPATLPPGDRVGVLLTAPLP